METTTIIQPINKPQTQKIVHKILLICGILSSLLYVVMNIFVPVLFKGYNFVSQTVSELSAIGAPTRAIWVLWGTAYTLLFTAFGFGVRMSAHQNRRLLIAGNLLILYGVFSLAWPFAPMHLRGAGFTLTDAMHITLGIVTVTVMLVIIAFGIAAFRKWFRFYSIVSMVIFIVFGTLTGTDGPRIAKNLPTPWIGIWERINIGVFMLWIIVLAIVLLRAGDSHIVEGSKIIIRKKTWTF
jgi:hypothetical protein